MFSPLSRRTLLKRSLQAGAIASVGDFSFLNSLPAAAADEKAKPATVELSPEIEPLVRLIEDTDQTKVLDAVAARIREGTTYQQLLAATLLAGVRGIKPRPVGFQFHAVLVINSAHLASLAAADNDRWLPLFWAVDNFKSSQKTNKDKNAGWMMSPVDEVHVPSAENAKKAFAEAMDNWDEAAADCAAAALARHLPPAEAIEQLWRYGARDFRDIGHKAIFVANSWRALQAIGWHHAEPVLRSLAFALLQHEGDNPAKRDGDPDRPGRENLKRVKEFPASWQAGKPSAEATTDLLDAIRTGSASDAAAKATELAKKGVAPASLWDGVFLGAGEMLMRAPGIVGLHCVTSANALHQAYCLTGNDETRRLALLQAASFLPLFRKALGDRGAKLADLRVDKLEKAELKGKGAEAVEEIFAEVPTNKELAAKKTLAFLEANRGGSDPLMKMARRLIFTKGRDSHDYKYSSAVLEDYFNVSPRWRNAFLAMSLFQLRGANERDNDLVKRTRAALAKS
jgi:hypothetical protein